MMKKPPERPRTGETAPSNVVPFPQRPESEMDEENYRILSTLLVNEFEKFKGRPIF